MHPQRKKYQKPPDMAHFSLQTGENNPILRATAEEVPVVNDETRELIRQMKRMMKKEKGVGLAAPQAGVGKRVILVTIGKKVVSMINPVITSFSVDSEYEEEGCLSVPGVFDQVERASTIAVAYLDENGEEQERELSHFDARVVQHEIDHLNGVLFTDRLVSKQKNALFV